MKVKWTYEKCKEVSLLCIGREDMRIRYRSAYNNSMRGKWLDEFFGDKLIKKSNYNTFEKCKGICEKYTSKKQLKIDHSGLCVIAKRNGWYEELTKNYVKQKTNDEWLIYLYIFSDNYYYVGLTQRQQSKRRNNYHMKKGPVFDHMKLNNLIPKYIILNDHIKTEKEVQYLENYWDNFYVEKGFCRLNTAKTGSLGSNIVKYTYEVCKEIANNCNSRTELNTLNQSAYESARKNKWLDEFFGDKLIKESGYWSYEKCKEVSLLYNDRTSMRINFGAAYNNSKKNKWLDEFFPKNNK